MCIIPSLTPEMRKNLRKPLKIVAFAFNLEVHNVLDFLCHKKFFSLRFW